MTDEGRYPRGLREAAKRGREAQRQAEELRQRLAELEAENEQLRAAPPAPTWEPGEAAAHRAFDEARSGSYAASYEEDAMERLKRIQPYIQQPDGRMLPNVEFQQQIIGWAEEQAKREGRQMVVDGSTIVGWERGSGPQTTPLGG